MEVGRLIDDLGRTDAFPEPTRSVEIVQTHISVVFLRDGFVYKVKKPVAFGFLDFSTLERRLRFCREEVALNRALAPGVYLGIVRIVEGADGRLAAGGECGDDEAPGDAGAADYAVRMNRLPADRTFASLLDRGELSESAVERAAERVAGFHREAERGGEIEENARFDSVRRRILDNLAECRRVAEPALGAALFEKLDRATLARLDEAKDSIERRASLAIDGHGDLHAEHFYHLPDRPPPGDLLVVDRIEFNARFRQSDPAADVAFATMDLAFRGRPDLARRFAEAYARAAGDEGCLPLLPLYESHRATVRGKVEALRAGEPETPEAERPGLIASARAHLLFALGRAASPGERPFLALLGGLPGAGKSEMARRLAARGFARISTDLVRKESASPGAPGDPDLYSPQTSARVYAACLERVARALANGERVVADATFVDDERRASLLRVADELRVPALFAECEAPREVVRSRMGTRQADGSDADLAVRDLLATKRQPWGAAVRDRAIALDTNRSPDDSERDLLDAISRAGG